MNLHEYFDWTVLINLERRPDRLNKTLQAMQEANWPFRQPDLFAGIDGSKVPSPDGWGAGGGAWGCMQSHRHILERALQDNVQCLLVLEDDLVFRKGFLETITQFLEMVPSDWDQLMLGGQHVNATPKPTSHPGVVRCVNCQRTHAYAIRGKMMRDLYQRWISSYGHCDHIMGPMQHRYNVYAPDPFPIGQSEGKSDISGANNSRKFWSAGSVDKSTPVLFLECPTNLLHSLRRYGLHLGHWYDASSGIDRGLSDIMSAPPTEREWRLSRWLDLIIGECADTDGMIATVYHPNVTLDMVRRSTTREVIHVKGATLPKVLGNVPANIRGILRGVN